MNAFDANGDYYRRRIRVGLRRGEFVPERAKNGATYVIQTANPTGLNLANVKTGAPVRHELGIDKDGPLRLCWRLIGADFDEAVRIGATAPKALR